MNDIWKQADLGPTAGMALCGAPARKGLALLKRLCGLSILDRPSPLDR